MPGNAQSDMLDAVLQAKAQLRATVAEINAAYPDYMYAYGRLADMGFDRETQMAIMDALICRPPGLSYNEALEDSAVQNLLARLLVLGADPDLAAAQLIQFWSDKPVENDVALPELPGSL